MAENDKTWKFEHDSKQPVVSGEPAFSWSASEFIDHKQGARWFAALAAVTVILAGLLFLITSDWFGSIIIILLGVIVGLYARKTPRQLQYEISDDGLKIEQKLYPYNLFKTFSVVQDGILTSLDLLPVKRFMPVVSAYFDPADQEKILAVVQAHLPYEARQLDAVEKLTRSLKF